MDRQLHPLINALARRFAGKQSHAAAHREVEKFQSICFHERYFGEDRMGGPGIVRLVQVPMRDLFGIDEIARALAAAFAVLPGGGPRRDELASMGRGYEQHAFVLGSPLGKTLARPADKERALPQFLVGAWGRFEALLEKAIDRSVAALEAVWAAFSATDAERDAADRALAALLPSGTIDPDGLDVDLDRPFEPIL